MKQVGEFWLPDIDLRWWSHWGKTRRKTLARYGQGGPKTGDIEAALAHIPAAVWPSTAAPTSASTAASWRATSTA